MKVTHSQFDGVGEILLAAFDAVAIHIQRVGVEPGSAEYVEFFRLAAVESELIAQMFAEIASGKKRVKVK